MDLAEVKHLIKCLIAGAGGSCSIQELLIDFEEETGFGLPHFNHCNEREFLLGLTDIIRIVNTESGERTVLVDLKSLKNDPAAYATRFYASSSGIRDGRPDFSGRNIRMEDTAFMRSDIDAFITAYQMGWVTVNEFGQWERVRSIRGTPPPEGKRAIEDVEFLFAEYDEYNVRDVLLRRSVIKLFLRCMGSVQEPERRMSNYPLPYHSASEDVRKRLRNVMPKEGIWLRDLPALYNNTYGSPLDCREHGYRSLLEMVKSLKDIFRCMKPFKKEVYLYNACIAPDSDEDELYDRAFYELPEDVVGRIMNLLENHCKTTGERGIRINDFLPLYYKKYRLKLDYVKYGFADFETMLSRLNGKILRIVDFKTEIIIRPLMRRYKLGERTIFSLTPDDDVYSELFPVNCVGFDGKYEEMKPECHFGIGETVDVNICDVISPSRFFMQLKKFENDLTRLSDDMLYLYKYKENDYRMPDATIRVNQICAAAYRTEEYDERYERRRIERWYRSIIRSIPDSRHVVVEFVDNCRMVKLSKEKIRFLLKKFHYLPKQGFVGKMRDVKPAAGVRWDSTVVDHLRYTISGTRDTSFKTTGYESETGRLLGELRAYENNLPVSVSAKLWKDCPSVRRLDDGESFPASDDEDGRDGGSRRRGNCEGWLVPAGTVWNKMQL